MPNAAYWTERYRTNKIGWDIGGISPAFQLFFDSIQDKNASILIPGCGNAHEARYLLQKGFKNCTLVDISPLLVENLREDLQEPIEKGFCQLICTDFFSLEGTYDFIFEQTFFCALDPSLRPAYCQKMAKLLSPNGHLVGLLFNRAFLGGPPFGGTKEEYLRLFSDVFVIHKMEDCTHSIPARAGTELWFDVTPIP
ncbi:MAG: methyltransferase domain-containing protein [Spirosomataceae bacterium]